jgi:hypothetical protein
MTPDSCAVGIKLRAQGRKQEAMIAFEKSAEVNPKP